MTDEAPQEAPEGEEQEAPAEDTGKGDIPKKASTLDEAHAISKTMATQIQELKDLIARQEQLAADNLLRGKSDANIEKKEKEESDSEYRKRVEKEINAGTFK